MPYPIEDAVPPEAMSGRLFGTTAIEDRVPSGPPPDRPLPGAPAGEPEIPRHRGLWFTLASATALVVLAPSAGHVYSWMFDQSFDSSWTQTHPITGVRVDVVSGDVQIGPGAAGQALVRQSMRWVRHRPLVRETWEGDTLVVRVTCADGTFLLPNSCSADLDLKVPAAVPVTVTARSGNVAAAGLSGTVHVETDSGDIQLTDDSGTVVAHAISGSVTGQGLTAPDADVQADSGDVALAFSAAPDRVVSRVVSGNTLILVPRGDGYLVTGQTLSGQRTVDQELENGQSARIVSADSDSGDVEVHAQN